MVYEGELKKGDIVRARLCSGKIVEGQVLDPDSDNGIKVEDKSMPGCPWYFGREDILDVTNKNNMNIKEKFLTLLKREPFKSFRKAKITNGDDILTEDGRDIFLSWMLMRNGADFKKEVVDELLEEAKDDK